MGVWSAYPSVDRINIGGILPEMLSQLINLSIQMTRDAECPVAALRCRDRRIGCRLQHLRYRPLQQIAAWLEQVQPNAAQRPSDKVVPALWGVSMILVVMGLMFGVGVVSAVFSYDGSQPVNITRVLWVFVVLPVALLLLVAVALLPASWLRALPPLHTLHVLLGTVNAGQLWWLASRLLPQEYRASLASHVGHGQAHQKLYGQLYRWQLLRWSRLLALAYQVGAAGGFVVLVALEDRAFVWQTQIEWLAAHYADIVGAIASLWGWAFPDAVPSPALVEATQYYRYGQGVLSGSTIATAEPLALAQQLGRWWPFVLGCLLVYGVLPRLLTWGIAVVRHRSATRWLVTHLPGVDGLLERLNQPDIQTHPEAHHPQGGDAATDEPLAGMGAVAALPAPVMLINWASTPLPDGAVPVSVGATHVAGGARTLDQDRRVMAEVTESIKSGAAKSIVVAVRGWEPPIADLFDFIGELRQATGAGVRIMVYPVALTDSGHVTTPPIAALRDWRRKVSATGDPWLDIGGISHG